MREANERTTSWITAHGVQLAAAGSVICFQYTHSSKCSAHIADSSFVKPARLHFARAARALAGRYIQCVSEASCPNFQPRARGSYWFDKQFIC